MIRGNYKNKSMYCRTYNNFSGIPIGNRISLATNVYLLQRSIAWLYAAGVSSNIRKMLLRAFALVSEMISLKSYTLKLQLNSCTAKGGGGGGVTGTLKPPAKRINLSR